MPLCHPILDSDIHMASDMGGRPEVLLADIADISLMGWQRYM